MKKIIHLFSTVGLILALQSCKHLREDVKPTEEIQETTNSAVFSPEGSSNEAPEASFLCSATVSDLMAGQHHLAGSIKVGNDAENIYVTFTTTGDWKLKQTQLYVGPLSGLPAGKNGNPKIGNFPYKSGHNPYVTSYTYTIPRASLKDSCIIVAAHAEVKRIDENGNELGGETAWGAGKEITSGGSWATYSDYCICGEEKENDNDSNDVDSSFGDSSDEESGDGDNTNDEEVIDGGFPKG